jgi:hypothetical protein
MIVKRVIFKKVLSTGAVAEFLVVKREGDYEAALTINGKVINGPSLPRELTPPKDDLTHWMGNMPSVGLTLEEAEKIIREVELENSVLKHHRREYE